VATTATGAALGVFAVSHQTRVGGSAAEQTEWTSDSSVTAKLPAGGGEPSGLVVAVTAGAHPGTVHPETLIVPHNALKLIASG